MGLNSDQAMAARYDGAAPAPARVISLGDGSTPSQDNDALNVGSFEIDTPFIPDPETLTPGTSNQPVTISSPPPSDPAEATEVAILTKQVGELIRALGAKDKKHTQELQALKFDIEMQLASANPQTINPNAVLPQGINPEDPATMGQLVGTIANLGPFVQAQIIRGTWDVSPTEELAVLQQYPNLNSLPEPVKSQKIKQAVNLMRQFSEASETHETPENGTTPSSAHQATPTRITQRQARPTVPIVERSNNPQFEEPRPVDNLQMARAKYAAADRIKDKNERLKAKKAAYLEAVRAAGLTDEMVAGSSWKQS